MEASEFFTYSWHIDEKETNRTVIRIYGLNAANENVCVIINNFTPYVYIELPQNIAWDEMRVRPIVNKIEQALKDRKPIVKQIMYKKHLYYADVDEKGERRLYPYLFCSFSHTEDIKQLGFIIRKPMNVPGIGIVQLKLHEANAGPILQLVSMRDIPTAGWCKFVGKRVTDPNEKVTNVAHEYIVKWKDISRKDTESVARPLLMGYDIEVNSSNPNAMPRAGKPEDKIFQISCIFARQGSPSETWERYLLTLGDCDGIADAAILQFETESDLLLGFVELMKEKQPNIVIGYNIFTFDIPYMIDRAKLLNVIYDFDRQGLDKYGHAKEKTIEWSSSAYKNQSFQFLDAEGVVFVDLLPLVKRDYKLGNYKLKTLSTHFLKDMTKDPLDAQGIFKCYRIGMQGGEKGKKALALVGKYCIKDSELVVRLFEVLKTWIALCQMSKVTNVPVFALFTQGQQLKVFSQVYKKCTRENMVVEKDAYVAKEDERYVGATVFPPTPGIYNKVVPFDFNSLYPTAIIAHNLDYSTLVRDETKIDLSKCRVMEWEEHIGCVHDPKVIRKKQLDDILGEKDAELQDLRKKRDLKSNKDRREEFKEMIAEHIKKSRVYREERSELLKSKPKVITCCKRRFVWLKYPMGVLPELLTHLLDARAKAKKDMKGVGKQLEGMSSTDPRYESLQMSYEVYDQIQNALKISANSVYGSMGVKRGYLAFMPGAMCTTYIGRTAIEKAARSITDDFGGKLIYGDTDSNYVSFPDKKTAEETWDYAIKVADEVSKLFPKPMKLAFEEKLYWQFMMINKKRYMCLACLRDGKVSDKMLKKGVLLNRRDNSAFIRNIYEAVIMKIFHSTPLEEILDYIVDQLNRLCSAYFPFRDFVITKAVGNYGDLVPTEGKDAKTGKSCWKVGDYKVTPLPTDEKKRAEQMAKKDVDNARDYYMACLPAQVQLAAKMGKRGNPVAAGTRLEYVITTNGGHNANQNIKVEDAEYFEKHRETLRIDYLYYMKQLSTQLDQVIDIIYAKPGQKFQGDFVLGQYRYRVKIRAAVLKQLEGLFKPKLQFH